MKLEKPISPIISSNRDNYADFLKYFLIWMVILGHFINYYQYNNNVVGGLHTWIYTFHMPLFVFISGHFSKQISNVRRKSIDMLLFPFVLFQFLNIVYTKIIPIEPLKNNIFYPYHQNWYLIALFWWRTFIPYHQFFKKWVVICFSFLLSLSVGFFPEWSMFMGLYKTACLLPFFVLGVYCENLPIFLQWLIKHKRIWISFFALSTIIVFTMSLNETLLLKMNYAFKANMGYDGEWQNLLLRLIALIISLLVCASVLLITKLLYNKLGNYNVFHISGGGTMLAYLGHEFLMIPLLRLYFSLGSIGIILCIVTSILVTYVLTRKRLVDFFSPLLDMNLFCKKLKISIYNY